MDNYQNQNQSGQPTYQQPYQQSGQQYQQPSYQAPPVQNYSNLEEPVTVGEWIITYIVMAIPLVGLIMLFVWAFGNGAKKSKKTLCQAALIMGLIGGVLAIIATILFGGLAAVLGSSSYYY